MQELTYLTQEFNYRILFSLTKCSHGGIATNFRQWCAINLKNTLQLVSHMCTHVLKIMSNID